MQLYVSISKLLVFAGRSILLKISRRKFWRFNNKNVENILKR